MPGMLLFGRRWMVGSDDLVFPLTIAFNIRLIWLIAVCTILAIHHEVKHIHDFLAGSHESCQFKTDVYLLGYIILLGFTCCFDAVMVFFSGRGTIFNEVKRRVVPSLVYARLFVYVIELAWLALGVYWIFIEHNNCSKTTDHFLSEGLVIFNLFLMLGVLFSIYLSFDTAGHIWYKKESQDITRGPASYGSIDFNDMIKSEYERNWERSCKALFCCSKVESSADNVFGFVARQLAEYFHDQVNLVPSDIVAGLILLRQHQKGQEAMKIQDELSSDCSRIDKVDGEKQRFFKTVWRYQRTKSSRPLDLMNKLCKLSPVVSIPGWIFKYADLVDASHPCSEQKTILAQAVYFSSHTMAIYGWPGYLYRLNLCSMGCCRLMNSLRCAFCCCRLARDRHQIVDGDNCCFCNVGATELALDVGDVELVYISYHDEVFEPPFFVAVDHKAKAVVICCRGTLSLKDVLTDLMIEEERIPVDNGDPAWQSHSGMLSAARFVLDRLTKSDVISRAFLWNEEKGTQHYRLTLVGHSLGAGVASILAFLLRPKYPDLVCFAYSPPGCTFNYAAAKYSEDFIFSVIIGKDVVPRLNLYTMHELKCNIMHLIRETQLPKWQILRGCLCQCMLCCYATGKGNHEDYIGLEMPDLPAFTAETHRRCYVGGKVIHIVKTKSLYPKYIGKKKAEYDVVWASVDDFQSILISTLMWKDHLPDSVHNTLQTCLRYEEMIELVSQSYSDSPLTGILPENINEMNFRGMEDGAMTQDDGHADEGSHQQDQSHALLVEAQVLPPLIDVGGNTSTDLNLATNNMHDGMEVTVSPTTGASKLLEKDI